MNSECFVPECNGTTGAPFPRDPNLKRKWLEGLDLKDASPKFGSYVCFKHFEASCLTDFMPGTRPSNRLKRGVIPTIRHPETTTVKDVELAQTESEEEDDINICRVCMDDKYLVKKMNDRFDGDTTIQAAIMLCCYPLKITPKDHLPKLICKECLDNLKVANNFRIMCLDTDEILREHYILTKRDNERKRKAVEENGGKSPKRSRQTSSSKTEPITATTEESTKTVDVEVALIGDEQRTDTDHTTINDLNMEGGAFEIMYENADSETAENDGADPSAKANLKIEEKEQEVTEENKDLQEKDTKKESASDTDEQPSTSGKIKLSDEISKTPTRRSKRIAVAKDLDTDNFIFTSLKQRKNKSQVDVDEIEKNMEEIHGKDAQNIKKSAVEDPQEKTEEKPIKKPSDVKDNTGTSVEDVLNTLEEDSNGSDEQNTEETFIKSLNLTHTSITDKSGLKVIKYEKNSPKQGSSKKLVFKTNTLKAKKEFLSNIKLPKDIKIRAAERFQSSVGTFSGTLKQGIQDNFFLQADGYLFEFGLLKNSVRHLRCAVPICNAHAEQKVNDNGDLEEEVFVRLAHNHPKPIESAKKKQMFLCLMRRKMQTDKTLNIRNAYEEACMQDPDLRELVPLRNVINEICRHQLSHKPPQINTFEQFYGNVERDPFEKLHFTHSNQQFYQEKFSADDGSLAILFGNIDVIQQVSDSKIMCVDASFKIDTSEDFKYQLVTILVWVDDSYYPILFALVNKKSQDIFRKIFTYLYDVLAPNLRPQEIITDYEANLYYALAETYVDSSIGGSVFYYTQNLYKKICSLNLSRDLETNSYFRNVYHMLLMLPLLPVNTILDGLNNIELEARNMNIADVARPIFDHVRTQWIINVTPELFCVHKLENRINENVIAPFKKLRDFLLLTKGKTQKTAVTIAHVIEKLIELEAFLRGTYSKPDKKSFGRDLSSFQKKNVLRAWQFIEDHPKIEISNFFSKVLGYIKCMENQLWIWGFYRYDGDTDDTLINASHFSIVNASDDPSDEAVEETIEETVEETEEYTEYVDTTDNTIVMDAVVDTDGMLHTSENESTEPDKQFESAYLKYVYQ